MSKLDIVIKGGTVVDGLQTPRYKADVGIADGRVVQIGRVDAADAAEVVDGSGRVVAPGFVDLHTHYDSQLFWDPWCTMSGWHGVTSVVIGNCGFGFAPCKPEDRDRTMLSLSRNEAVPLKTMQAGMPWDWVTFPEFLDSVNRTAKGVNVMAFVPLAPLYSYVAGVDNAKAHRVTDAQLEEMCRLLVEGMEAGGCGFSAQISGEIGNVQLDFDGTPMVTDCMTDREVIAFSRAMGSLGRGAAQLTGTLEAAALMARESGRPIIWNALLADGALNQHGGARYTHRDALKQLAYLNEEEGLRVFAQALTTNFVSEFTLEDYNLADTVPCWKEACLGTVEEKIVKFADPVRRAAMKEVHERARRPVRGRLRPERDQDQLDLQRCPQRPGAQGALRGLLHRRGGGERRQARNRRLPRRGGGWTAAGRIRHDDVDDSPGVDEGDSDLPRGPARCQRRWGPHQVHYDSALPHRTPRVLGARA